MSHFTVAVFTKEGQTIEELLAPYQENNMGDCPKEYLAFNDVEEEYRKQFESDTRKEFYCNSNSSWGQEVGEDTFATLKEHSIGDAFNIAIKKSIGLSYFKKDYTYKCYYNKTNKYPEEHIWLKVTDILWTNHPDKDVCFEGMIRVKLIEEPKEISLKEYYNNDFELFIKEWAGYKEKDLETGKYGYWENPNAKWDWFQVGGRWSGLLKIKEKATSGVTGTRSWTNEAANIPEDKVDSAKVKDIDFSLDIKKYNDNLRFWELIVDGDTPRNSEEETIIKRNFNKPDYYSNRYENKEQFAKLSSEFGTYAVITPDGQWHSKGDMGWWGASSETDEEAKQWNKSFKETFIDNADPEWTLTVVDCHI
ncbi:hypothetical protein Elgi_37330 [Paenibacillus elgii]|uniref:hypothetical protein n=1 Tax=Paenibacillus elgii TaxID=189691 RepID=UPI002D7B2C40|nr:hypothetical protein Elgi_37330 [Paenibacillus elgii]